MSSNINTFNMSFNSGNFSKFSNGGTFNTSSTSGTFSTFASSGKSEDSYTTDIGVSNLPIIGPLESAITMDDVKAADVSWIDLQVKEELLYLAKKLLEYDLECELWEPEDYDPFTVSLSMLEERLLHGQFGPPPEVSGSRIPSHQDIKNVRANVHKRTGKSAMNRPLEEFQDLYHALVAKVKEIYSQICVQVNNGFLTPSAVVWYQGPTLEWFAEELVEFWEILNDPNVVQPLDDAIRRENAKHMHAQMLNDHFAGKLSAEDLKSLSDDLYEEPTYANIAGLEETNRWAPAMIHGWLAEKYRVLLLVEHDVEARKARLERKEKQQKAEIAREAARQEEVAVQRKKEQQQAAARKAAEEKRREEERVQEPRRCEEERVQQLKKREEQRVQDFMRREEERMQEYKRQAEVSQYTRDAYAESMAATREKMRQEREAAREAREFAEKARRVEEYGRQLRAFCRGAEFIGPHDPVSPPAWWIPRVEV